MGKSLETTKGSVWALFLTAHAVLIEKIEVRLTASGLPPLAWYDVLWALERAEGERRRMSELADRVVLSRSNLTRLVDRLEEAGFVARERSADDRRGAYAVLTASGRDVRRRMWPTYQAAIRELFENHLSDAEVAVLGAVLKRILSSADRRGTAPGRPAGGRGAARVRTTRGR